MEHEHTTEQHERDEREMDDENRIGCEAEAHGRDRTKSRRGAVKTPSSTLAVTTTLEARGEIGERAMRCTRRLIATGGRRSRRGFELA